MNSSHRVPCPDGRMSAPAALTTTTRRASAPSVEPQKNASDPEARKTTRIARYPTTVASRTQTAASRGVPLAADTRAIGLEGNKSLDSAKRMREAATIDANAPPKAEQMASPSNRSPDQPPK